MLVMKIAAISDVHVKNSNDSKDKILISFLRDDFVKSADAIFLLGDIFDLMIGPHSQYFKRYQRYFDEIKFLISNGKKVYYIQGNHDFHLEKLYKTFFKINEQLDSSLFKIGPEFVLFDNGKSLHLSHGDDIEIENPSYQLFKKIVTSAPLTMYANNLMPYFLITKVGEFSSKTSRKRNLKRYSKEEDLTEVKEKFRRSVEVFYKKNPHDVYVCGHSHVKDLYMSDNGFIYINNGYAENSKTYMAIIDGHVSFRLIKELDS
jgi:UDP-2,3-diacylglucosamine hydrolase